MFSFSPRILYRLFYLYTHKENDIALYYNKRNSILWENHTFSGHLISIVYWDHVFYWGLYRVVRVLEKRIDYDNNIVKRTMRYLNVFSDIKYIARVIENTPNPMHDVYYLYHYPSVIFRNTNRTSNVIRWFTYLFRF